VAKQAVNEDQDEGAITTATMTLTTPSLLTLIPCILMRLLILSLGLCQQHNLDYGDWNRAPDTYLLGTLSPRLYQTNPSARRTDASETGEIKCELTIADTPATA
jgi:hypothetical protein